MARCPSCVMLAVLLWVWPLPASGQTFTGDGPLATDPFPLSAGLLIIELDHEGTGEFRAHLFDGTGGFKEELADVTGAFAGSRAVQVPAGDHYLLDVSASGEWRVRFRRWEDTRDEGIPDQPELEVARARADSAAAVHGSFGWFGRGLLAGALAGPIGAGVATLVAGREPGLPAALEAELDGQDPVFVQAFHESYRGRLRSRRQRAALRGGIVGSALLAFAIIKWSDFARPGGGDGGQDGPVLRIIPFRYEF